MTTDIKMVSDRTRLITSGQGVAGQMQRQLVGSVAPAWQATRGGRHATGRKTQGVCCRPRRISPL